MFYPKGFINDGYPLCPGGFAMKPKGIEYKHKRTKYACFKDCKKSAQPCCLHVIMTKSNTASVIIATHTLKMAIENTGRQCRTVRFTKN
jgi:hypothetical protein